MNHASPALGIPLMGPDPSLYYLKIRNHIVRCSSLVLIYCFMDNRLILAYPVNAHDRYM